MSTFLQACVNGLLMGGFYSLMGMGQNIISGGPLSCSDHVLCRHCDPAYHDHTVPWNEKLYQPVIPYSWSGTAFIKWGAGSFRV